MPDRERRLDCFQFQKFGEIFLWLSRQNIYYTVSVIAYWDWQISIPGEWSFTHYNKFPHLAICAGHAFLRWRKECGRLWVLLESAVQAPIPSITCAIKLIDFYQWYQALKLRVLMLLPQMMIIFKSQQCWVQLYAVIQVISRHYINPSWINFVRRFYREIIWKFCVIRLLTRPLLTIHLTSFEVQFCLKYSKRYSIYNKCES